MRKHICIICGAIFNSKYSFVTCPKCGSLGTTYSTESKGDNNENVDGKS